jgi:hypothetical protein
MVPVAASASDASLAKVIDLPTRSARRGDMCAAEHELAEHVRFLQDGYGDRWPELPDALGRQLVRAEALLASGPAAVDSTVSATDAVARARLVIRAAVAIAELIHDDGEVLEQVLSTRLVDLSLDRMAAVADAVLGLAAAPRAEPSWAAPSEAHAASVLLDAHGDDLREGARLHHAVYAQFTERIWDVPERRLKKGRRAWRPIAWLRLRRSLAATSRTMKAPSPMAAAADLVVDTSVLRNRMLTISQLLARHLGAHDAGPLTDVDAARASLAAVQRLHAAVGDRLDAKRLVRLLDADAFKDDAVLEPARNLRTALLAWAAVISTLGGADPLHIDLAELTEWATSTEALLPVIEMAAAASERAGGAVATLRGLANDLLARERFNELTDRLTESDPTTKKWSAS